MPIDFTFTDEQEHIRRTVREFAEKFIAPRVFEMEQKERIPDEIIKGMARLGLFGVSIPEEYGGLNLDPVTAGVIVEELARADLSCSVPVLYLVHTAWSYIAQKYGRKEFKEEILPLAAEGKLWIGIATTEPGAGSDLLGITTTAKREGDDYIVNGEKAFISGVREAYEQFEMGGGHLTLVKTDPEKGHRGMTLMYIPMRSPGITIKYEKGWGRKAISWASYKLDNVRVPAKYVIGEEGRGFYIAMEGFDYARALISVVCCAVAKRSLELAMDYIKQRKAFGVPLAKFEGIQFVLAEHWSQLEAAHLLAYRALWALKMEREGKMGRFEVTKFAAEAKMLAVRSAIRAIDDAMRWFGAFGYTEECPLTLAIKAVKSYEWAEGATDIMKIIVARELLGREFLPYR